MNRWTCIPLLIVSLAACNHGVFGDDPVAIESPNAPDAPPAIPTTPPAPDGPESPAARPVVDPPPPPATEFVAGIDHDYLPYETGRTWVYAGTDDGQERRDEVTVLSETVRIDGVACTAVRQHVYLDGALSEITTEWFAQDRTGSVWKFGEESFELEDGVFTLSDDSWTADQAAASAWLLMRPQPAVGDVYQGFRGDGEDIYAIVAMGIQSKAGGTSYSDCVEALENPEDEDDRDTIIYAPNVGMISESHADGKIELVEATKPG